MNAFIDKPTVPTVQELAAALGPAKPIWDALVADLASEHKLNVHEWKSVSPKYGWSLRLKLKKRNIVYLSPHQNCFTASFVLGDKAIVVARSAGLPVSVIKMMDEARRYAEGTGVRIEVNGAKDVAIVKKLTRIKLAN